MSVPPEFNKENMLGFKVEMAWSYIGGDGGQCFGWYNGVVVEILNSKSQSVKIEWNDDCLGERDQKVTRHQLKPGNWNPNTTRKGAWRQYLTE